MLHQNSLGTVDAVLTVDIVEAEKECPWTERFSDFTRIEDAAAELLAGLDFDGEEIHLNGLTELSDSAAASLGGLKPGSLYLDGLISLSDRAFESLGKVQCDELILDGITSLSEAAAKIIGEWKRVEHLFLDGLTSLSDAAAESLSKYEGTLNLSGLTELSDAAAESLSKHEGRIRGSHKHF